MKTLRRDDYVAEDSPVRVIDVFIDELDLSGLGFETQANEPGRPAGQETQTYHPRGGGGLAGPAIRKQPQATIRGHLHQNLARLRETWPGSILSVTWRRKPGYHTASAVE